MKTILLTILLTFSLPILANQTKIQIAVYSKYESAKKTQLKLDAIIEKDFKLKKLLEKNNISSVIKKKGKHHIVSIEPFYDKAIQSKVLRKLKRTQFYNAYVLEITPNKKIIKQQSKPEPKIEAKPEAKKQYTRDIPKYVVNVVNMGLISSKVGYYIIGSEKFGNMRKSFAFINKDDAIEYTKKHGGCVVDYDTYLRMDDEAVKTYVKEHGIVIVKDTNVTKTIDSSKNNVPVNIYSKENLDKYR